MSVPVWDIECYTDHAKNIKYLKQKLSNVPRPIGDMHELITAASPPDEPPTVRRLSYGLLVVPIMLLRDSCLSIEKI